MPHLFVSRPRTYPDSFATLDTSAPFRSETVNAFLYKLGGLIFIFGSVLFFPALHEYMDYGSWAFFFGSLVYLVVTVHDLQEVRRHGATAGQSTPRGRLLEYTAAYSYVIGTVLFTVGSILFLSFVDQQHAGAWCFVTGSALFVLGACVNVLQIFRHSTRATIQLTNLTAITFVVGSVLFTVASVPYLWQVQAASDRHTLYAFLAWQYLTGSVLFFLGGVFNYWKAFLIMRRQQAGAKAHAESSSEPSGY